MTPYSAKYYRAFCGLVSNHNIYIYTGGILPCYMLTCTHTSRTVKYFVERSLSWILQKLELYSTSNDNICRYRINNVLTCFDL